MKYILIVYLLLSDTDAAFIVPQYTFQSQSACIMALEDIRASLKDYSIFSQCVPFPEERDS